MSEDGCFPVGHSSSDYAVLGLQATFYVTIQYTHTVET